MTERDDSSGWHTGDAHIEVAADDQGGAPVARTLARLAERLGVALACSECCIYEFLPERDSVLPKALWGIALTDDDRAWVGVENHIHRQCHIAPVFDEHRIVVTQADEEALDPDDRESMAYWGEKTALYAPIMDGDEFLGVVELVEHRERREFTDADLRLVTGLADVAAVAIANARASSAAEMRNRHLTALLDASRAITSTVVLEEVLQRVTEEAARALDAPSVYIYEYDPLADAIIWHAQYQADPSYGAADPEGTVYSLDDYPDDREVIVTRAIRQVTQDDVGLKPSLAGSLSEWNEKTLLTVPLVFGDDVVGLMEIAETRYVRRFTDEEVELARALGDQAAAAIRNAQLYRREKWRSERLVHVLDISQVVGGSLDPGEVVEVVRSRLGRLFGDRETSVTIELEDADGSAHGPLPRGGHVAAVRPSVSDDGAELVVPLLSKGRPQGELRVTSPLAQPFGRDETELVRLIANQVAVALENARLYSRLEEQAITDGLTGLYNHRFFYDRLDGEVKRARRYGFQFSLLMLDLDDFKSFNDEYGHQAGDRVLAEVGRIMREQLRKDVDVPCRYGGEEFAIILPHTPSPGAETVGRRLTERMTAITRSGAVDPAWLAGERVRRRIEHEPFPGHEPQETTHITVSVGVATYPDQAGDATTLVANADKALYVAKRRGKNRVEIFS